WKMKYNRGFDNLLTHSPAYQFNDGADLPHRGFAAFRTLLDKYKPVFFVHGHVHLNYGAKIPRLSTYNETQVVNAYEKYIFEIDL
ncbi:MAG: metallophosphoesterase, partial [Lachnospiraceae bacterium]|nr:metallophosphoesterase [Lachnospiraceae bacterium]